ncbi:MAG: hypothetical protein Q8M94_22180 [Ignavibacteria bacterium]|nr:hypothetical protein [Ignavibacteria bacterium]
MKNSNYYFSFVLFLVFIFPNNIYAQEDLSSMRYSLYGGASLPQGDFSSTTSEKAGYAKIGFCGMLEGSKSISESVNWTSSFSLAFNSLDESAMEDQLPGATVTTDNYVTAWIMTGIGFETIASPTVKIYGLGQIGLLFSSFPDIKLSSGGSSITQTTKMGTSFGYGFGVGVIINKINLGIRYFSGEPEYEQSASYGGMTSSAKVKLPATVLQLLIGFAL